MVGILGIDNTNVENCGKKIEHTLRLKPRLHVPNFLLEMALQFQEIIVFPSHITISVCCVLCAGNATTSENCRKIKNSGYSDNFSIGKFYRVARLQFSPRGGNTIISENCLTITREKLPL